MMRARRSPLYFPTPLRRPSHEPDDVGRLDEHSCDATGFTCIAHAKTVGNMGLRNALGTGAAHGQTEQWLKAQ
jgi:hypothetical protein